ncbi:exo-beta-N-acetylmuramidase NamZ family protein [Psychroflexus maritimus]|uniref:DUF1343 domain-containing protein n=1 Tax=Psychroflexus maritimus TaxID=2714865 RepID=A0A967ADL9_9FLAO|nr:DUF1343 domain-containing protein [Psychroflexus maritimus]NGZ90317.1 DUF1343 domain-containing protein [Psychroflexus maritimus]
MFYSGFKNTLIILVLTSFLLGGCQTKAQDQQLVLGIEQIEQYLPLLVGKKVGVVGNQTSVLLNDQESIHLVDLLLNNHIEVERAFAPEHGFRGTADAGEQIQDGKDAKTGIPVVSLYGTNKKPTPEQMKDLDFIVFDIQDVGARFYTYISTLHYVMQACATHQIPILVLDRPNPNGHYIDGPVLELEHQSFVGMHPIPVVHGLTIAEYARMINGEGWLNQKDEAELFVIPMKNYNKEMEYDLPVPPSPNLPNAQSVNLYPSLCFFEGTKVNAGRGTNLQFQVFGSPYLNEDVFNYSYTPVSKPGAKYPKFENELCYGKELSKHPQLDALNLEWLILAYQETNQPNSFFNSFFTKLAGTKKLQQQIETGFSADEIKAEWQSDLKDYRQMIQPYLLYDFN